MLTWVEIGRLLLSVADKVAGYFRNKQLMDAGEAKADARYSDAERERLDAAMRARVDAGDDSVRDPFDAANRR